MQDQEKSVKQASGQAARASYHAVRGGAKVVKGVATGVISRKAIVIAIIAFLFISILISLPAGTSTSQMQDTYYLSVKNGETVNRPSEEEREAAMTDQERARKKTTDLLEIVTEIKQEDLDENIKRKRLQSDCRANGWDYDLTLEKAIMDAEVISVDTGSTGGNSNIPQQSYELDSLSKKQRRTYTTAKASEKNAAASKVIYTSEKTTTTSEGFLVYDSGQGDKDYLVKMGAYFGGIGNRFLITFSDGSTITVLKAETFTQAESGYSSGMAKRGGGILEFLIDADADGSAVKKKLQTITAGSTIKKVELLESEFSSQSTLQMSTTDSRVIAGYSVYLDNMELEMVKKGLTKQIVNQRGDTVQTKWIWSDNSIDLEKSLRKVLRSFLKGTNAQTGKQNSFYELDYKRNAAGDIIVESVDLGHYEDIVNEEGEVTGQVWVPDIHYYATPIIIELDINSIAEELYNLNPADPYINSGTPYKMVEGSDLKISSNQTTVREAINTLAENTDALLFNMTGGEGSVIISGLQGQLLWPAPGCTQITSPYGRRARPTAGASVNHMGIDIAAPMGTPIIAADAGVVSFAGYYGGGGNWISIKHSGDMKTDYGHLSKILVKAGQPVEKGQVIAYSGNTGVSTGPHLHFQVVVGGNPVNPVPYVTTKENDVTYS